MAHQYPKNRATTKGRSPYQIYLDQRKTLTDKGYILESKYTKKEFMDLYNLARERNKQFTPEKKNKKEKNIIRTISRSDIVMSKTRENKAIKSLIIGENLTLGKYYDFNTGHLNFEGASKKDLYYTFKEAYEQGEDWVDENWKEMFYRGHIYY